VYAEEEIALIRVEITYTVGQKYIILWNSATMQVEHLYHQVLLSDLTPTIILMHTIVEAPVLVAHPPVMEVVLFHNVQLEVKIPQQDALSLPCNHVHIVMDVEDLVPVAHANVTIPRQICTSCNPISPPMVHPV
jgi:hypothetical protein